MSSCDILLIAIEYIFEVAFAWIQNSFGSVASISSNCFSLFNHDLLLKLCRGEGSTVDRFGVFFLQGRVLTFWDTLPLY
jgi:hypothetical protein